MLEGFDEVINSHKLTHEAFQCSCMYQKDHLTHRCMGIAWIVQEVEKDSQKEKELHVLSAQQKGLTQTKSADRRRTPNGAPK